MEQEIKLEPSEDLDYWAGALQTDGCICEYFPKGKKHSEVELAFGVCSKSLPMLEKVRPFGTQTLKRHGKIYKIHKRDEWRYHIKVKQLLDSFKKLDIKFGDPPVPPEFFGAYLAGVIDGDECISVKRLQYPRCTIYISSGSLQTLLKQAIMEVLGCSTFQRYSKRTSVLDGRIIKGIDSRLEFLCFFQNFEICIGFCDPSFTTCS